MRRTLDYLAALMFILSSGAVIQLIMDGGARNQGLDTVAAYNGFLNYLPVLWKLSVVCVLGLLIIVSKRRHFQLEVIWFTLLILCLATALWAEFSKVSFDNFVMILLAYLFINVHVEVCGWLRVIRQISITFMAFLILSLLFIIFIPSYGVAVGDHLGRWQGVFIHKNMLGNFAAMTFFFYLWNLTRQRTAWVWLGLTLSVGLAIGSECSTGLINIAITTIFFILLRAEATRRKIFLWRNGIVVLLIAVCIFMLYLSLGDSQIAIGDKDTTFSDRNRIWAYVLMQFLDTPWLGHGLGQIAAAVSANDANFQANVGFVVNSAHNGFIESLHAIGIVGLLLIVALIFNMMRFKQDGPEFEFAFLFVLFFVLLNMFESKLLSFNIFFIMLIYVQKLVHKMPSKQDNPSTLARVVKKVV